MVESPSVTTLIRGAAGTAARRSPSPAGRRPLGPADWLIRAPLGLFYLVVLALLAVPVAAVMTLVYYLARAASFAARVSRPGPTRSSPSISS